MSAQNRNNSDKTLLEACIRGERHAWDQFVEQYSNLIYHAIRRTFNLYSFNFHYHDIEDLHNGVFLSLIEDDCKKLRQFKGIGGCSVATWLVTVTTNLTINFMKRKRDHLSLDDESDDKRALIDTLSSPHPDPSDILSTHEQDTLLSELMQGLSVSDQLFLKYYYEDDLPPEQIARAMHISVSSVYSKKSRVIDRLQKIAENRGLMQDNGT